jgi:hypothetical protein
MKECSEMIMLRYGNSFPFLVDNFNLQIAVSSSQIALFLKFTVIFHLQNKKNSAARQEMYGAVFLKPSIFSE